MRLNNSLYLNLLWLLVAGCAIQGMPTGGKPDETPPQVVKTRPANQSLNVQKKEVIIRWDSYPKAGIAYGKEVLVSPFLQKEPKITVLDKHIRIQFREDLLPNTTYVITLTDITDHFSNLKISTPYIYAFSTGAVLDSMKVEGKVVSALTGKGEADMKVLLFAADSVRQNTDIWNKKPLYLTKTNAEGDFLLTNLHKQIYKIFAIKDADNSHTYNQLSEQIALDSLPDVRFGDSVLLVRKQLVAFLPDNQPPRVKNYEWLGDNCLAVEVNEMVLPQRLSITLSDTLGKESQQVDSVIFVADEKKQLYFYSPRKRQMFSQLQIRALGDSLGNSCDTTLRLFEKSILDSKARPFARRPQLAFAPLRWEWLWADLPAMDSLSAWVYVQDSAQKSVPLKLESKGLAANIQFDKPLNPKQKYKLCFKGALFGLKDSVLSFPLNYPDEALFGKCSGNILTEGYSGKIVAVMSQAGGGKDKNASSPPAIVFYTRDFNFQWLAPGSYTLKIIYDTDANGTWTPGDLKTNRLPERIFSAAEPVVIKANWEMEKLEIRAGGVEGGAPAKGKAGKDTKPASKDK